MTRSAVSLLSQGRDETHETSAVQVPLILVVDAKMDHPEDSWQRRLENVLFKTRSALPMIRVERRRKTQSVSNLNFVVFSDSRIYSVSSSRFRRFQTSILDAFGLRFVYFWCSEIKFFNAEQNKPNSTGIPSKSQRKCDH